MDVLHYVAAAFHYAVAIAGYVGAVIALLVAVGYLIEWFGPNVTEAKELTYGGRVGKAFVAALVLALLSSILIRLIE